MVKSPFFSIIIPCYKVEECFDKVTASVLNQSFKDIELILVNDCSPGDTPRLCDSLAKNDSRVKVIHRKENGGGYAACNDGIDIAIGEYIVFIDNDDYFEDGVFQKAYDRISECHASNSDLPVDILQCDSLYVQMESDGIILKQERISTNYPLRKHGENKTEYVLKRYVHKQIDSFYSTRYLRRAFVQGENLKFDLRYPSAGDFDISLKAYIKAQRIEHCDIFNFAHVERAGSISTALSTKACISRLHVFADWFDFAEGMNIDKAVKEDFLTRMAKEISKIWLFAATGKYCRDDVDKKLIWSTPAEQRKYIKYIPIASTLPPNPLKLPQYLKKNKNAVRKWRRKRMLLKKGALAVFGDE